MEYSMIPWTTESVKYLGMLFDKTVTFQQHINYVVNKVAIATRIVINRKSKLSQENKLLLYKVALRPISTSSEYSGKNPS